MVKPCVEPQVEPAHYEFDRYVTEGRWASYWCQINEILKRRPSSVLEIGVGAGIVRAVMEHLGLVVESLDIDPALRPDCVGSVHALPYVDRAFDVVACYEVLEHIPWEMVPLALNELRRVCTRYALISLPDARPTFRVHIPVVLRNRLFNRPLFRPEPNVFDGEHYWEINRAGYPLSSVIGYLADAGFCIEYTFRPYEANHYRFFCLRKA